MVSFVDIQSMGMFILSWPWQFFLLVIKGFSLVAIHPNLAIFALN